MTSKATAIACRWITARHPEIRHFTLESNFATDKKRSQVNTFHTRGKRVIGELTLPAESRARADDALAASATDSR